jgi:hypothetical protein
VKREFNVKLLFTQDERKEGEAEKKSCRWKYLEIEILLCTPLSTLHVDGSYGTKTAMNFSFTADNKSFHDLVKNSNL